MVRVDVKTSAISGLFHHLFSAVLQVYDKPDIATIHPIPMYEQNAKICLYVSKKHDLENFDTVLARRPLDRRTL